MSIDDRTDYLEEQYKSRRLLTYIHTHIYYIPFNSAWEIKERSPLSDYPTPISRAPPFFIN